MTDLGNLLLALLRLRCAEKEESGLVGSTALLGRRVSYSGRASPPVWLWEAPRKGLIRRPMLNDSRRGAGDSPLGRRAEPSSAVLRGAPMGHEQEVSEDRTSDVEVRGKDDRRMVTRKTRIEIWHSQY